jgi:hypothetical protein
MHSVVVVGAMNPAIHHPSWYEINAILTAEEVLKATQGAVIISQQVSQFTFGPVTVTCDPLRWQVQTTDENAMMQAVQIAERTFAILKHTPVSAFGFNFTYHKETRLPKVKNVLAHLVLNLPIGLRAKAGEEQSAKLSFQHGVTGRNITVAVENSVRRDDFVYVAINFEYRVATPPTGGFKMFDLNLMDRFPADLSEAREQVDAVIEAVNHLQEN